MNRFMLQQCENMIQSVKLFEQACKLAALQDNKIADKEENKVIEQIKKANDKYIASIEKIIRKA